jgi:hypothetical protein
MITSAETHIPHMAAKRLKRDSDEHDKKQIERLNWEGSALVMWSLQQPRLGSVWRIFTDFNEVFGSAQLLTVSSSLFGGSWHVLPSRQTRWTTIPSGELALSLHDLMHHRFSVYNKVQITLTTNDVAGLSDRDVLLANFIESIAKHWLYSDYFTLTVLRSAQPSVQGTRPPALEFRVESWWGPFISVERHAD